MNGNRIIELINNPELLSISDENHIKWELEKYPFVQSFHSLSLKWKLLFSEEESAHEVEQLSVYSTHRELIKELITHTEKKTELKNPEIRNESDKESPLHLVITEENSKQKSDSSWEEEEIKVITDEMNSETVSNKGDEEVQNSVLTTFQKEENSEQEDKDKNDQMNINKLGISYLFVSRNEGEESHSDIEDVNSISSLKQISNQLQEKVQKIDLNESIVLDDTDSEIIPEEENIQIEEINKSGKGKEPEENLISENIVTPEEKLTFNQWLLRSKNLSKNRKEIESGALNEKTQTNRIEEFIENNPKITPPKKGVKNRQELDFKKEEIKDIANLMTITLAQLYVEQARYDTAITAYKILSLKYPEKSGYFALEIKNLKKLKNSK